MTADRKWGTGEKETGETSNGEEVATTTYCAEWCNCNFTFEMRL